MIRREAENKIIQLSRQFKSVALVGPRQSGKTTLVRKVFRNLPYVNLEAPDIRNFAMNDPRGFLDQYSSGAVLDEAQRVPELFSYLQQILDESPEPGRFIITGSNNFLLQQNISQSLAGRIAYLYLLPFSMDEIETGKNVDEYIFKGSYPPVYDQPVDSFNWYINYTRTYVERDVRQLKNISDLNSFEKFIKLCAGRIGQLLNMSNLAIETGVDSKTIGSWISILESSFIVYRLFPHHKNFNKRVVKMPKLYFYDTGLACSLLGLQKAEQLVSHHMRGNLFENLIINEFIKNRFNQGLPHNLYFWRDNIGHEIDLLVDTGKKLVPVEIKSGKTVTPEYFSGLEYYNKISGQSMGMVIYAGDTQQTRSKGITVLPWKETNNFWSLH